MTPWFARTAEMAAIFMVGDGLIGLARSEERRVGKECRL